MNRLAVVLATWFGCGYFPWGPGTAGSLAAILIAVLLHRVCGRGATHFADPYPCVAGASDLGFDANGANGEQERSGHGGDR